MPAMCAKCFVKASGERLRPIRLSDGTWTDAVLPWKQWSCTNPNCGNHPTTVTEPRIEVKVHRAK